MFSLEISGRGQARVRAKPRSVQYFLDDKLCILRKQKKPRIELIVLSNRLPSLLYGSPVLSASAVGTFVFGVAKFPAIGTSPSILTTPALLCHHTILLCRKSWPG